MDKMIHHENLRITPYKDYSNQDRYGDKIGDREEGMKSVYNPDNFYAQGPDDLPPVARQTISMVPGAKVVSINSVHIYTTKFPECHIFSASSSLSAATHESMGGGYDCCYEIDDADQFFHEISKALIQAGYKIQKSETYKKIVYSQKFMHYRHENVEMSSIYLKPEKYKDQNEYRSYWKLENTEQQSIDIEVPGISKIIREVEIPKPL
ncbi:MAG TPA: hypothetical protein VIJ14_04390 [Rhabdochlamydiaceae bacterium]